MKKTLKLFVAFFILLSSQLYANEGKWIPMLLDQNMENMQRLGLRLTAEEIYSINQTSLKDAVVHFGGFCTGTLISPYGLVLTNHHCGRSQIQAHSTLENNLMQDGFWAMSRDEELPNPGLFARFLVRVEDVTEEVLATLNNEMSESERDEQIRRISTEIENRATEGTHYDARVASFFEGNEFFLQVFETFLDVRLVGAPPNSIGMFGGSTDNWTWPRHVGDLALFRIYTAPDGSPAPFAEENIPMRSRHYLPISLDGINDGDFAMILGFPGRTDRFATSFRLNHLLDFRHPTVIEVRTERLGIIDEFAETYPDIRWLYAGRYLGIANLWKNSIAQTEQLRKYGIVDRKVQIENDFREFARRNPQFADVLSDIESAYQVFNQYEHAIRFQAEAIGNIEPFMVANHFASLQTALQRHEEEENEYTLEEVLDAIERITNTVERIFGNSYPRVELRNTESMLRLYSERVPRNQQPEEFVTWVEQNRNDFARMAQELHGSVFASREGALAVLNNWDKTIFENDKAFKMARIFAGHSKGITEMLVPTNEKLRRANRLFVQGYREMNPDRLIAPNANSTMRLTYGQILGYSPEDGVHFSHKTTLTGVMEKENPDCHEFVVPARLRELYETRDFGIYAEDGNIIVNFITNNDIIGGNSGSSLLNADGEIIGLVFSGNRESTGGTIFLGENARAIHADIRYVLFIIDKFAGARHLIQEMSLRAR
ncbi:MAG: S46 family peptidase [Bacteroidales bacterium]|nr:S46 family peptidase [Bacteroidales bacterium]